MKEKDVRFLFHVAFIDSTNREKMLHSTRYYLGNKLEPPSAARRYRIGNLIFVSSNHLFILTDTIPGH